MPGSAVMPLFGPRMDPSELKPFRPRMPLRDAPSGSARRVTPLVAFLAAGQREGPPGSSVFAPRRFGQRPAARNVMTAQARRPAS